MMSFACTPPKSTAQIDNTAHYRIIQPKVTTAAAAENQKKMQAEKLEMEGRGRQGDFKPLTSAVPQTQFANSMALDLHLNEDTKQFANSLLLTKRVEAFKQGGATEEKRTAISNRIDGMGCRFKNGNLDIDLIVGPENQFVHISTIVCDHRPRQHNPEREKASSIGHRSKPGIARGQGNYSFMTRIAKINAMLPVTMNVRICQGKVMIVETLDVSLLQEEGQSHVFFDRLRTFLTNAVYVEKDLSIMRAELAFGY